MSSFLIPSLLAGAAGAQLCGVDAGTLDLTFAGTGSNSVFPIDPGGIAVQPDGKILVLGWNSGGAGITRVLPNGLDDPAFGSSGSLTTYVPDHYAEAVAAVVQVDGKIVSIGSAAVEFPGFGTVPCLFRYLPDGTLDPSFGAGGIVVSDLDGVPGDFMDARAGALQPDGKIVVAGVWEGGSQIFVARYLTDGSLDASFGVDGWTGVNGSACDDVFVQADGKIVVAAKIGGQFAVRRFHADGSNDTSFGLDGAVAAPFPHDAGAHGVHVFPDGRILAVGHGDWKLLAARFLSDGSPDVSFGQGGFTSRTVPEGLTGYIGATLAVLGDGRYFVGTEAYDQSFPYAGGTSVSRYLADGTLDAGFGNGGFWTSPEIFSFPAKIALEPEGRVVVTAQADSLYRIHNPSPSGEVSLDTGFGSGGTVASSGGAYLDVDLDADGGMLLTRGAGPGFLVERRLADGTLDPSFGTGGVVQTPIAIGGLAVQSEVLPDGKIVSVGHVFDFVFGLPHGALTRLLPDGTPDPSFGVNGADVASIKNSEFAAVATLPDGRILAGGYQQVLGQYHLLVTRFDADGSQDSSFGSSSMVAWNVDPTAYQAVAELRVQPDGKILAAGFAGQTIALARFEAEGADDAGFGIAGKVNLAFERSVIVESMHLYDDGRILVVGTQVASGDDPNEMLLIRFLSDGSLDTTFGLGGIAGVSNGGWSTGVDVEVTNDGRIYVVGNRAAHLTGEENNVVLARFDCAGNLDSSFGPNGLAVLPGYFAFAVEEQSGGELLIAGESSLPSVGTGQVTRLVVGPTWEDLGQGLAGTHGATVLSGLSGNEPGSSYSIRLSGALENSFAWLLIGVTRVDLPIAGGVLVPSPDLVLAPVATAAHGSPQLLTGPWDPTLSGVELFFQAWTLDPAAPSQFSASNGLSTQVP